MEKWQLEILDKVVLDKTQKIISHSGRGHGKSLMAAEYTKHVLEARIQLGNKHHEGLLDAGWIPTKCSEFFHHNWSECHTQCREIFGDGNYTWTGDVFWFRTEEDIMVFKLTFGA